MKLPLPELLDRYSIVLLKTDFLDECWAEREAYEEALGTEYAGVGQCGEWVRALKEINARIWDMEAAIRAAQERKLPLEEVGRRALAIRDINRERVALKNQIAQASGEGWFDCKVNHCSQET